MVPVGFTLPLLCEFFLFLFMVDWLWTAMDLAYGSWVGLVLVICLVSIFSLSFIHIDLFSFMSLILLSLVFRSNVELIFSILSINCLLICLYFMILLYNSVILRYM